MKKSLLLLLSLAASSLQAAPSTELATEWFVPLVSSTSSALVDKESGQIRVLNFNPAGTLSQSGPAYSGINTISGLASGYLDGGTERLILASATNNRLSFVSSNTSTNKVYQPEAAGPISAAPIRRNAAHPPSILVSSLYGNVGGHALEMIDKAATSPATINLINGGLLAIQQLQPLRNPDTNQLWNVATYAITNPPRIIEFFRSPTDTIDGSITAFSVPTGSRLAADIIGDDGRTTTIAYLPGQTTAEIFTHGFSGFTRELNTSTPALTFPIGTISTIPPGIPGAPHGLLITALDGSTAVFATLNLGAKFIITQTFTPSPGREINGLLPIPGQGLIALERNPGEAHTSNWRFFRNSGGGFVELSSGQLSPWLPAAGNFATLFWFNGAPLLDPTAELISLQHVPDWTLNPGSLPRPLSAESFISPSTGLANPSAIAPAVPAGSNYVLTNQYQASVSVSALADNLTLSAPSARIIPESGSYLTSVTINALYDESAAELLYRKEGPGQPWQPFTTPLTVGYPSTWLFHTRDLSTGTTGPIISRTYSFSTPLNEIDTDRDGIPDYVEEAKGLDPAGGADSDGDFQSDYEELLAGTDPLDHTSNTPANLRNPPYLGEGFYLFAQAYNATTGFASPYNNGGTPTTLPVVDEALAAAQRADDTPGTKLNATSMAGTLLATGEVKQITQAPLAGQFGARLDISNPVPAREWIILSSPTYFNLGTGVNPPRNGRETFRILQRPSFTPPNIAFVPSGTNQTADANAWIASAQAAQAAYQPVTSVTRLEPEDLAIAVMAERSLHDALLTLPPADQAELGIPSDLSDFTLFPLRDGEAAKTPLSRPMIQALLNQGCDFPALLTLLNTGRSNTQIVNLCNAIYNRHVAISATTPNMALPLDALRSLLNSGTILDPSPNVATSFDSNGNVATSTTRPNPYASISNTLINNARNAMLSLVGNAPSTKRPTATWNLEIQTSTVPGHAYDYRRTSNNQLAYLVDQFGERFLLEQGLGLNLGSLFTVTGYIDVNPITGFDTMEIISIDLVTIPATSDNDQNANLLDDEWELFFFGQLGLHGPFDPHPITGHSYLQYHLEGADPRAGSLNSPIVILAPLNPHIDWLPAQSAYQISWDFPAAFLSSFNFTITSTTDLGATLPFGGTADATEVYELSPGRYAIRVTVPESSLPSNFFRIEMSLATP